MGSSTTAAGAPEDTVLPYATGLNGVNQPVNLLFKDMLWWTLGIIALVILTVRLGEIAWSHQRLLSAMNLPGDKQNFWKTSQWSWMPWIKKYITYSPLWKKRHNREIRLSSAINVGTLPSRLHAIVLGLYFISNLVYMFILNWGNENKFSFLAELRGRSGTLAAVNMVPLVILAGRNNPLIPILRISFDTYNLLHRWMGRVVIVEALIHMVAWGIVQISGGGWASAWDKILHDAFCASGMVGTLAFVFILILSLSPVRHAFYETFLNTHIILAVIVVACTWIHCAVADIPGGLPQLPWVIAIVIIWMADRFARVLRMAFYNNSKSGRTTATVEAAPGEACRVTLHLPKYVDVQPGSHAYLRFPSISFWESHPFSIAWVEHTPIDDKLPVHEKDGLLTSHGEKMRTSVSFVIGAQTGFTRKLYNRALESGKDKLRISAIFEGPYAGHNSMDSYGHVVLFAGATGITHQLSYIKHLIEGANAGTLATRKIVLVWVIRDFHSLEWIRPWMDQILPLPNRKKMLSIRLFVTRPKNPAEIRSASATVQMSPGRPNIPLLLEKEVAGQMGAMCVSVCGPGALADDVRSAVLRLQGLKSVESEAPHSVSYVEESFTW